jgi:hypothetical protein
MLRKFLDFAIALISGLTADDFINSCGILIQGMSTLIGMG